MNHTTTCSHSIGRLQSFSSLSIYSLILIEMYSKNIKRDSKGTTGVKRKVVVIHRAVFFVFFLINLYPGEISICLDEWKPPETQTMSGLTAQALTELHHINEDWIYVINICSSMFQALILIELLNINQAVCIGNKAELPAHILSLLDFLFSGNAIVACKAALKVLTWYLIYLLIWSETSALIGIISAAHPHYSISVSFLWHYQRDCM